MQLADPQMLTNPPTRSSTDTRDKKASISKEENFDEAATARRVGSSFKLFSVISTLISFWRSKLEIAKDMSYERFLDKNC
jgi:hypothetical protein